MIYCIHCNCIRNAGYEVLVRICSKIYCYIYVYPRNIFLTVIFYYTDCLNKSVSSSLSKIIAISVQDWIKRSCNGHNKSKWSHHYLLYNNSYPSLDLFSNYPENSSHSSIVIYNRDEKSFPVKN